LCYSESKGPKMRNKTANLAYFSLTIALVALQLLPAAVFAQNQNPSRADATPTGFEQVCDQVLVESQGIAGCINKIYLFSLGAGALIALMMPPLWELGLMAVQNTRIFHAVAMQALTGQMLITPILI